MQGLRNAPVEAPKSRQLADKIAPDAQQYPRCCRQRNECANQLAETFGFGSVRQREELFTLVDEEKKTRA